MKYFKFYFISIVIVLLLVFWGLNISKEQVIDVSSDFGKADLSSVGNRQVADIGGKWEFYDQMLYEDFLHNSEIVPEFAEVPHLWAGKSVYGGNPYGYATYKTELSGLVPDKGYGILIQEEAIAYRLWINGEILIDGCKVGRSKDEYQPDLNSHWATFNSDENGKAVVIIEVANFDNFQGGLCHKPIIGEFEALRKMVAIHTSIEVFLFTSMMIMGLFFFAIYAMSSKEKPAVLMGLFSILVAFRILFNGYHLIFSMVPFLSWDVMQRITYGLGYVLLPVAGYLIFSLDYINKSSFVMSIYHGLLGCAVFLPAFASNQIYIYYYEIYKYAVILVSAYIIGVLTVGIIRKKTGAIPVAIGCVFIIAGSIVELFYGNHQFVVGFSTFIMISIFLMVEIVSFDSIKSRKENLEAEIIEDKLTSVYNRFYLEQLITGSNIEKRGRYRCYVMFIDINHFKSINDTYGHKIGDMVLIHVANALKHSVRESDKIFRYGGDEFLIIVYLEEGNNPKEIGDRIHMAVEKPFEIEDKSICVSISIGITEYHIDKEALYDAIIRSDEEMYQVKKG